MIDMRAAKKAAELANAVPGSDGLWDAKDFLFEGTPSDDKAFVQFITDADKAARKAIDAMKANPASDALSIAERVFSPFILPDELDPLLIEARKLAGGWGPLMVTPSPEARQQRLEEMAEEALRRGMELAKEQGK